MTVMTKIHLGADEIAFPQSSQGRMVRLYEAVTQLAQIGRYAPLYLYLPMFSHSHYYRWCLITACNCNW